MNEAILIVPPSKHGLVFDPAYREIFGDLATGVYFPIADKNGNWIYRLPPSVAESIKDAFPELGETCI